MIPAASILQTYVCPSTEKGHCVSLSPPSSTFLSSTLIWKKTSWQKRWDCYHRIDFTCFPFSLCYFTLVLSAVQNLNVLALSVFFRFMALGQDDFMFCHGWKWESIMLYLACIFKPYIKLTIWVRLHSSVIIQNCLRILIIFFSFVSLIGQLLFMWHIKVKNPWDVENSDHVLMSQ